MPLLVAPSREGNAPSGPPLQVAAVVGADTRTVNRVKSCSPAVASASRKASPAKRTSSVQAPESTKTTSVVSPHRFRQGGSDRGVIATKGGNGYYPLAFL